MALIGISLKNESTLKSYYPKIKEYIKWGKKTEKCIVNEKHFLDFILQEKMGIVGNTIF